MLKSIVPLIVALSILLSNGACKRTSSSNEVNSSPADKFSGKGEDDQARKIIPNSLAESEYPHFSKDWWIYELRNNYDGLVSDISSGKYDDQELIKVILLNRDNGLLDAKIAPLAMDAWLKHWNPVGKNRDDLIKQLGPPDRLEQDFILYEFMENGGAGYIFYTKDGQIISWRREDRI
jgi:hypothetical protein